VVSWGALCVILPFCIFFIVYHNFLSNYTYELYSPTDFAAQYEHGIYRYRIIGRWAIQGMYGLLAHFTELEHRPLPLALGAHGNAAFFAAYFCVNLLGQIALNSVLWVLLRARYFALSPKGVTGVILAITCVVGITQFVITPYDTLNYFLLAANIGVWIFFQETKNIRWLLLGCALLMLNTLVRESAAVALSAFWAISVTRKNWLPRPLWLPIAAFLVAYIGLRLHFGWTDGIADAEYSQSWRLYNFTSPTCLLGDVCLLLGLYVLHQLAPTPAHRQQLWLLVFGCTPYLAVCFYTGITAEIRLWVPIWVAAAILINRKIN
jgi:hypothetical protein